MRIGLSSLVLGGAGGAAGLTLNKNLVPHSSDLANTANWSQTGLAVLGTQLDPFGGLTGFLLQDAGGPSPHTLASLTNATIVNGQNYCFSLYAKPTTNNFTQLLLSGAASGTCYANFDLTTGLVSGNSAGTALNFTTGSSNAGLASGWWRVWITFTSQATTTTIPCPRMADSGAAARTASYVGTGAISGYYGPQLETGLSPTSYSPT